MAADSSRTRCFFAVATLAAAITLSACDESSIGEGSTCVTIISKVQAHVAPPTIASAAFYCGTDGRLYHMGRFHQEAPIGTCAVSEGCEDSPYP